MMQIKNILTGIAATAILTSCSAQKTQQAFNPEEVTRIISTLSADDMEGRGTFTPGIAKAASFIENEFKQIGLQPLSGDNDFRQEFSVLRILPVEIKVTVDGQGIDPEKVIGISDKSSVTFSNSTAEVLRISAAEPFIQKYRTIIAMPSPVLVMVDPAHASIFKRLRESMIQGRVSENPGEGTSVFVLGAQAAGIFNVSLTNKLETLPLFNVTGMIPGKSRAKEVVLFSAHYDHLGIVESVEGDSIANGADDDASGTTAVIALAKYYKQLNNNERTLIFVAFTAEEIGGLGSRHFSSRLDPDDVTAMFNIEMIGKESRFGKNAAFITGYDRSDFGEILQRNLDGTDFTFHPDPYPDQNLFYRSDNATLAALGVPAHTISTDQIDSDKFYHTVNDELETLDPANILATIKAIALSARSIISGGDTPKRIPKLEN